MKRMPRHGLHDRRALDDKGVDFLDFDGRPMWT